MSGKIASLSSNAILAKARAMYADMLTGANYNELAACRTINEAANYLKGHTGYSAAFLSVPNVKIHRARLEAVLKRFMLERIAQLCAYEKSIGLKLYQSMLLKNDIDCILTCADYLDSDNIGEYMLYIPEFFKKHTELDFLPLERAQSFEELYDALRGTRYQPLLENFQNGSVKFKVQLLDNILYDYFYKQTAQLIAENFSGRQKEELLDFFRMRADMKTVESIYRLKKYFKKDSAIHAGNFFSSAISSFSEKELESMLNAPSADAMLELVKKTRYGKFFPDGDAVIERKTEMMSLRINQKNMRFSTHPEVVFMSFIGLLENEMRNVTHIIEGIRYLLPPEEILKYLVKLDD